MGGRMPIIDMQDASFSVDRASGDVSDRRLRAADDPVIRIRGKSAPWVRGGTIILRKPGVAVIDGSAALR